MFGMDFAQPALPTVTRLQAVDFFISVSGSGDAWPGSKTLGDS